MCRDSWSPLLPHVIRLGNYSVNPVLPVITDQIFDGLGNNLLACIAFGVGRGGGGEVP